MTDSSTSPHHVATDPCCFCAELRGLPTAVRDLYPTLTTRFVVATGRFVAMPSIGQLAPGHMLLVPRRHVTSFGELTAEEREEAADLHRMLRRVLTHRYGPVVGFEHGSPPQATSGGCGIVHAHLHVVPMGGAARLPPPLGEGWRRSASRDWLDDAAAITRRGDGYLMWNGLDGDVWMEPATDVPSQYIRCHVANLLGQDDWDWRATGAQGEFVRLVNEFSELEELASAR